MEVDRLLYIFGSFTRKKDKRKSFDQSSISAGNSPLHLTRKGRPVSQNLEVLPRTSAYDEVVARKEFECGLCMRELVEPRLLGCLHSFCTRCLQGLHEEGELEVWNEIDTGSIQLEPDSGTASGTGSAGSGYDSDLRHSGSDGSWDQKPHKYGIFTRKVSGKATKFLLCPSCGHETPLPLGGVSALPVNHVLVRKMARAEREMEEVNVLCDLCTTDNKAESRCLQCVVSVCSSCKEQHHRQKATSRHSLHPLQPAEVKYCDLHPRNDLSVYCATCQVVTCGECCSSSHAGHALAGAARAVGERARALRAACARASRAPRTLDALLAELQLRTHEMECEGARVEAEIAAWREQYVRAVEAHARELAGAAAGARGGHRRRAARAAAALRARAHHAAHALHFADELLATAKDDELLSLSGPVLRRLERVSSLHTLPELPRCELRFSPTSVAVHDPTLVGRLFTRAPDPNKCVLNVEGLQDLRVDCPHEATLEIRDSNGERIWCGGEQVAGYMRRRDSSARPAPCGVAAADDGRYRVLLAVAAPGAYLLAVTVNNTPIQGSPFPCAVRKRRVCSTVGMVTCSCKESSRHKGGQNGASSEGHFSCCSTDKKGFCTNANLYHVSL